MSPLKIKASEKTKDFGRILIKFDSRIFTGFIVDLEVLKAFKFNFVQFCIVSLTYNIAISKRLRTNLQ